MAAEIVNITIKDKAVRKLLKDLIKQRGKIAQRSKDYATLIGAHVIADVFKHFEEERGPSGRWKPWSPQYRKRMIAIGKGGNRILQDTGRLKGGWQPARYRTSKDGIMWFNPVKYAGAHDRGSRNLPQRKFTWLSASAIKRIENDTAKFLLK